MRLVLEKVTHYHASMHINAIFFNVFSADEHPLKTMSCFLICSIWKQVENLFFLALFESFQMQLC
jgi:hypothetical protein